MQLYTEEYFMQQALAEAQQAFQEDEVPVGAVIVCQNKIIGRGYNQTERLHDVTAHAEMIALTAAANYLNAKYLEDCILYVTLEPCVMCAGALKWARPQRIVYGASDTKYGYSCIHHPLLHPKTEVSGGVLATACGELLRNFFRQKRGGQDFG
jgi:tRNA(adenine34) deaminase